MSTDGEQRQSEEQHSHPATDEATAFGGAVTYLGDGRPSVPATDQRTAETEPPDTHPTQNTSSPHQVSQPLSSEAQPSPAPALSDAERAAQDDDPRAHAQSSQLLPPNNSRQEEPWSPWEYDNYERGTHVFERPDSERSIDLPDYLFPNPAVILRYFPREINGLNLVKISKFFDNATITKAINFARSPDDRVTERWVERQLYAAHILYDFDHPSQHPYNSVKKFGKRREAWLKHPTDAGNAAEDTLQYWQTAIAHHYLLAIYEWEDDFELTEEVERILDELALGFMSPKTFRKLIEREEEVPVKDTLKRIARRLDNGLDSKHLCDFLLAPMEKIFLEGNTWAPW